MTIHIGPRTISAIGGSIKRVGNYKIHTFPSELVTDGLVLNLDAGDPRSYPGSGTVWTDLSGNGNTGTLTNGPTYNNGNGGSIVFDGTNDLVTLTGTESFNFGSGDFTIECWVYFNVVNVNQLFISKYLTWGSNVDFFFRLTGGDSKIVFNSGVSIINILSTNPVTSGTWNHICVSKNSNTTTLYINGISNGTSTAVYTVPNNRNELRLGRSHDNDEPLNGRISNFRIYKGKGLSAAEVAQNYDALKVRFTSYTNTFTPLCAGNSGKVEVLCVAGGGGGAVGGGGAGGLVYNSAFTVNSSSAVSLSAGGGGTGATYWGGDGINGNNSTFGSITAIGGGRGTHSGEANSGGSGGGGGYAATGNASGTSGQGNAGGRGGSGNPNYPGGGGGGAGSIGSNGSGASTAGSGGAGLSYSISGVSQFYAGGGGGATQGGGTGGLGGSGVGGNGASGNVMGLNGIPNTGSGGGGSGQNLMGGNGSNGVVIVRYPATDYNVELLIVGGGGGGGGSTAGNGGGGGGGAGGLIYYSSYSVSAGTKYTVTVGAGGTGQNATTGANGANGNNSVFGPLIAFGGGGGSNGVGAGTANNGGSGGGGGYRGYTTVANGGTGVTGQGNNGAGVLSISASGAGGGGAGGVGQSNIGSGGGQGGLGGVGLSYAITGVSVTYAIGGRGGGGSSDTTGAANTGNGGAGTYAADNSNFGYAGGSGIVIIAYQGPQRGIGGTVDTTSRPGFTLHRFTTTGTDFFIP